VATLIPLRGIRYNPEHVRLGGVLAPPYDVVSPAQREALYGRDLRNIVRIDFGQPYPDDVAGVRDVYTRAAEHLRGWLELGILVRDETPGLYLVAHEFPGPGPAAPVGDGGPTEGGGAPEGDGATAGGGGPTEGGGAPEGDGSAAGGGGPTEGGVSAAGGGGRMRRLGLLGRVPALPWDASEVRPHERTLRGPKEDRLALMRATQTQTSPVWVLWEGAPSLRTELEALVSEHALLGGRYEGEGGSEKLLLWKLDDPATLRRLARHLEAATLYIADGHHRFETAAAYAEERRAAGDAADADSQHVLVYASAADDPALVVLPIHRIVRPRPGLPLSRSELLGRLDPAWGMQPVDDPLAALSGRLPREHAYVAVTPDGSAVLHRARREGASPRASLDVAVLQEEVIARCGIGEKEMREGAVEFSRDAAQAVAAVREGRAPLALLLSPCTPGEVLAVADAGETMPQKSTYFYPKVPTGLVLSPL
jgi:uncharacterized protein (DUF1015 family)